MSADADGIVVERDGERFTIPRDLVVAMRVLPDRAVRTSEIRELETAAAHGWPGTDRVTVDGWLLRAGGGWSRRANSAVPLAFGVTADVATLSVIRRWYDDHGLPTTIAAVDRVLPAGAVPEGADGLRVAVMTRTSGSVVAIPLSPLTVSATPTDEWLAAVIGHRGEVVDPTVAGAVLHAVVDGTLRFASVVADGVLAATGRGAINRSGESASTWLGLSCLWTHPDHRGRGFGTAVVTALMQDARRPAAIAPTCRWSRTTPPRSGSIAASASPGITGTANRTLDQAPSGSHAVLGRSQSGPGSWTTVVSISTATPRSPP